MKMSNIKAVWVPVFCVMALGLTAHTVHAQQISVDLGGATLSGAGTYTVTSNKWGNSSRQIQSVSTTGLGADNGVFDYAFDPAVSVNYPAGPSYDQNYISGTLSTARGLTITPDAGVTLNPDSAVYKISGVARLSDTAYVDFRGADGSTFSASAKGVRSQIDDFPFELSVKASVADAASAMLTWSGRYPYSQGPGGTAGAFSSAEIIINKVEYKIAVVPEPETWALMGLGLVGLTLVRRQQRV